jgi:hypothetical protein
MGNPKRPIKPWHNTPPRPIGDEEPGGGGVVVDTMPLPTWRVVLEDLTALAQELRPRVTVRGRWTSPRFAIYAGQDLIGFVPAGESAEIRQAMDLHGGTLQGRVASVAAGEVVVVLSLEGR